MMNSNGSERRWSGSRIPAFRNLQTDFGKGGRVYKHNGAINISCVGRIVSFLS